MNLEYLKIETRLIDEKFASVIWVGVEKKILLEKQKCSLKYFFMGLPFLREERFGKSLLEVCGQLRFSS
jgi:hypothetical protein